MGSTPVLYPGSGSAAEAVPAPLRSASPKQLGRPQSAGRDIVSHPVRLSDHSAEEAGAVRAPLGHSLDRGALQQARASLPTSASCTGIVCALGLWHRQEKWRCP